MQAVALSALLSLGLSATPGGSPLTSRPRAIVFTDCDGTMLQTDHTLSTAASEMLHTLAQRGVLVVPATGRARAGGWTDAVLNAHPVLNMGNPGVYINGCSAFNEVGEPLASTWLPEPVVERVLKWFEESTDEGVRSGGLVSYVGGEALYTTNNSGSGSSALYERLAALGDSPPRQVSAIPTQSVYKMIALFEDDDAAQAAKQSLAEVVGGGTASAELTQALPGYIEVVPAGASKATACAALLERWGCTWADAIAIGDGSNDLPMLVAAAEGGGTSIAMGNAGEAVQREAQFVVPSNSEDGWVEAMERFVLAKLDQRVAEQQQTPGS